MLDIKLGKFYDMHMYVVLGFGGYSFLQKNEGVVHTDVQYIYIIYKITAFYSYNASV